MNSYVCECGCGNTYQANQMVRHGKEVLYIPHALEVFSLFKPPQEIREHFGAIKDYLLILPDEPTSSDEWNDHWVSLGWRFYSSKYGNYYLRKLNERRIQIK